MDSNNILSTIAIIISILGIIIGIVNHKEVRSRCCKREASFSIDITSTVPAVPPLPNSLSSDLDDAPTDLRIQIPNRPI